MERFPMRVPSLDDLCTTVVASVPESLADRDDETSVTDTALLRNVSGKDTASVNASPDLDLRFLPSTTLPLRLIFTGTPSCTLMTCFCATPFVALRGFLTDLGLRARGLPRRGLDSCSSSSSAGATSSSLRDFERRFLAGFSSNSSSHFLRMRRRGISSSSSTRRLLFCHDDFSSSS